MLVPSANVFPDALPDDITWALESLDVQRLKEVSVKQEQTLNIRLEGQIGGQDTLFA